MTLRGRVRAGALAVLWVALMLACAAVQAATGAATGAASGAASGAATGSALWDLADPSPRLDVPAVQVLHDTSGRLSVTEVAALPAAAFRAHSPGESFGFHEGTIWLRFELRNQGATPQQRWLVLPRLLQERVDLHLLRPDGAVQSFRSGTAVPPERRDLPGATLKFPLELEAGGQRTAYLSLTGRALSLTQAQAWHPAAYLDAQTRLTAIKYLAIGLGMVLALAAAMAANVQRRPGLWLGAVSYGMIVLYMLLRDGLGTGLLPADDRLWTQRTVQMAAGAAIASLAQFARVFLAIDRHQRARWMLLMLATLMAGLAAVFPIVGPHPRAGMVLVLGATAALMIVALLGLGRNDIANRSFLLALMTFGLTVTLRIAANAAWLDLPWLPLDLPVMGLVGASLILSVGLVMTARDVGRQSRQARQELLRQQASENERLHEAVAARTAELDQARQRAERESQAKSTFLSTMAHELRSPLHAILGYAGLLRRHARGRSSEQLALIDRHGRRLLQMVDQSLTYSRGEADAIELEPAPLALQDWLRELVDGRHAATTTADATANAIFDAGAGAGPANGRDDCRATRLQLIIEGPLPPAVEADEQRLGQVLGNLLDNALKYADDAPVVLRVTRLDIDASHHGATPSFPMRGQSHCQFHCQLRFEVIDQGPGIPAEQQAQAFQPFVRLPAQRHQPGVGLGLTIAASLVGRMGSTLRLHSAAGQGCRFAFELDLPVVAPPVEAGTQPEQAFQRAPAGHPGFPGHPGLFDPDPRAAAAARPPLATPPATILEPLQPMLELGQMIGMARWLEDFANREPAWRDFAHHARSLCLMADLPALQRWLARAGTAVSTGPQQVARTGTVKPLP